MKTVVRIVIFCLLFAACNKLIVVEAPSNYSVMTRCDTVITIECDTLFSWGEKPKQIKKKHAHRK